jgi:hypothetical protein
MNSTRSSIGRILPAPTNSCCASGAAGRRSLVVLGGDAGWCCSGERRRAPQRAIAGRSKVAKISTLGAGALGNVAEVANFSLARVGVLQCEVKSSDGRPIFKVNLTGPSFSSPAVTTGMGLPSTRSNISLIATTSDRAQRHDRLYPFIEITLPVSRQLLFAPERRNHSCPASLQAHTGSVRRSVKV